MPNLLIRCRYQREPPFQTFKKTSHNSSKRQVRSLPTCWVSENWDSLIPLHQKRLISNILASRDCGEKCRKIWTLKCFPTLFKGASSPVKLGTVLQWTLWVTTLQKATLLLWVMRQGTGQRFTETSCANNKRLQSTDNTNKHAEHVKDLKKTNTMEERKFKTWLLLSYVWRCHFNRT